MQQYNEFDKGIIRLYTFVPNKWFGQLSNI